MSPELFLKAPFQKEKHTTSIHILLARAGHTAKLNVKWEGWRMIFEQQYNRIQFYFLKAL